MLKMNTHINIGDKFVAVKGKWFLDEGTIVTVTNIDNHDIISFEFNENTNEKYSRYIGNMDYTSFVEHFNKIEEKKEKVEAPKITKEYIDDIITNSYISVHTMFGKCTVMTCRLPNGFVLVESSSCVNPENYNEEIGYDICLEKITNKIWELEGYMLQEELYRESMMEECPYGCENCNECPCEEENCN